MTPLERLFAAVQAGDRAAVSLLLQAHPALVTERGAHPHWGGEPTALHLAVENRRPQIVSLLLDAGADPSDSSESYDGWTPLLSAIGRDSEIVDILLAAGARVDIWEAAALGDVERIISLLAERPERVTARRPNDAPPLHFAATVDAAWALVERGAPLDAVDRYGSTAVRSAAYGGVRRREVARFLMDWSGERDPWLLAAIDDVEGLAELAADGVDVATVLRAGINPGSGLGETPMHTAAALGNARTIEFLIAHGGDPNAPGSQGAGPLHYAAKCGSRETVDLLLAAGANASARDDIQRATPAAWAHFGGHAALATYLSSL